MSYLDAKGWLSKYEREYLRNIAIGYVTILNVGIEYGASLHCFNSGDKKIVAIDLVGASKLNDIDAFQNVQLLDTEKGYTVNLTSMQNGLTVITGDSNKISLKGFLPDVTFIDGGHDYQCVKNDIKRFAKITQTYLLFHDYSDLAMHAGVKQALDEWHPTDFEFVAQVDTIRAYKRLKTDSGKA